MDLAAARLRIAHALTTLEAAIAVLVNALAHGDSLAQTESTAGGSPISLVCAAYSAINYEMKDEVGTSVVCLGVLGVDSQTLQRAAVVNTLKAELKAQCAPLHGIQVRVSVKGESSPTRKVSAVRAILRTIQRSDLNLLAAYRKIPILEAPPASITYTRAMTRSVYRKSIEEFYVLLNNLEGPTASADRARLSTLDPHESHLALVKERYQNVRANVLYSRLDARGRGRVQIAAELPILYARGRTAEPPEVQFPAIEIPTKPVRTRQSSLAATPFLECFPVYRYLRAHRP